MSGTPATRRRVAVGVTGASGAIYAVRTIAALLEAGCELEIVFSDYGRRLLAKMGLLAAMGVVTVLHAFWQGPHVRRAEEAGDLSTARRWRMAGVAADAFLLLAALAALWLAVSLVP